MAHLRGRERARYVAGMFSRIARRYDLLNTVMSAGRHYAWRRRAVWEALGGLRGPALDVAAGTGDFALELARHPGVTRVVGVDLAQPMLDLARRKAARRGVTGLDLLLADAHALPFPDESFICATVGFGVRNFADVPRALAEMARVVRPGGAVVVLEIVRPDGRIMGRLFPSYFRRVTPLLGSLLAGDREAYTYLPESVEAFLGAAELAEAMGRAGLRDIRHISFALGSVALLIGQRP